MEKIRANFFMKYFYYTTFLLQIGIFGNLFGRLYTDCCIKIYFVSINYRKILFLHYIFSFKSMVFFNQSFIPLLITIISKLIWCMHMQLFKYSSILLFHITIACRHKNLKNTEFQIIV